MRLVNYDVGEIADRLSILALKRLHKGDEANGSWKNEQTILQTQLSGRVLNGRWTTLTLELAAVNSAIWHAEDDLRETRKTLVVGADPVPVVQLAIRIQELNDRRAALIHELNSLQGVAQKEKG